MNPIDEFTFGPNGPMQKAWPEGYPIVRPGDRVRVTHLGGLRTSVDRGGRVVTSHAEPTVGEARNVERDGWFDVFPDQGDPCGFYVADNYIRVEVLAKVEGE